METMPQKTNIYSVECPTRQILDLIANRWSVLVIGCLSDGVLRFTDIKHRVGGISQKMLTQTLRQLERNGILTRTVYAEVPPRVEYALTPLGQTLHGLVGAIYDWADNHIDEVTQAQQEYDAQNRGERL
jgi:DNA-binding HxlR family transcriptional regulator